MSRVLVVGSYNHDHVWSADELPAPGATRLGAYAGGPGGKGFNQAVAAARAGAATTFVTALGDDAAAAGARALATAEGIALRDEVHPALATGTAGIFVDAAGRNAIVVAPGANAALTAGFVAGQRDAFDGVRVVLAQLEVAPEAVQAALDTASACGALSVLNPAPANATTSELLLATCDVLTPNESEFTALLRRHEGEEVAPADVADLDDARLHALCRRLAPRATLVITLGARGAFVSHGDHARGDGIGHYRVPAPPARAVDTTGAGDAFNGALACALAQGEAFAAAVVFACRFAALSVERPGAALAMPHRDAVRARFG